MALDTFSTFFFTERIDITNNKFNFAEGGPELTATLSGGLYSLEQLAIELQTALNAAGANTYQVSFLRNVRQYVITADATFDILLTSGTQAAVSPFIILGFTGADLTGLLTYSSNDLAGTSYTTQFPIQDYFDEDDIVEKIDASVNETASGDIETISFGDRKTLQMTFMFITNLPMDGKFIGNNPTGLVDARAFFANIIQKGSFEFMKDSSNLVDFKTLKLESTPSSNVGVGYRLIEETGKNLPGIYRIGPLIMRVIPVI